MASKTKNNNNGARTNRNIRGGASEPSRAPRARKLAPKGPVPLDQRSERALETIRKGSATPAEVANALRLKGSWAPQQAVAALESLVRSGKAKKRHTKDGQTVYVAA